MEQNDKLVLVYATFPDAASAQAISEDLVQRRLAACVNLIPGMTAIYEWEGDLHRDAEVVAVIKTRAALGDAVVAAVTARHGYANPAVLILGIDGGAPPYLTWLRTQTTATPSP